jgi:hypothetical protein
MEDLWERHKRIYKYKSTTKVLWSLIELQNKNSIFVCDSRVDIDGIKQYKKVKYYPSHEGGDNYFTLATKTYRKYWFSIFNYTTVSVVGKLKWSFRDKASLAEISFIIDANKISKDSFNDSICTTLLKFFNCPVKTVFN